MIDSPESLSSGTLNGVELTNVYLGGEATFTIWGQILPNVKCILHMDTAFAFSPTWCRKTLQNPTTNLHL